MSKRLLFLSTILLGAMVLFAPACGDKCEKKDCGNGICDEIDATCNCDPGYEYDADGSCKVVTREKLVGKYSTNEQCPGDPQPIFYEITVTGTNADFAKFEIFNFFNAYATTAVVATLDGNSGFTISTQKPSPDVEISGSGTYGEVNGKMTITMTYTVKDLTNNQSLTCTNTVFTK